MNLYGNSRMFPTSLNFSHSVPGIEDPGLQPDEYEASIKNLKAISEDLDAHFLELNRRKVDEGTSGHCLIRKRLAEQDFVEIRYVWGYPERGIR